MSTTNKRKAAPSKSAKTFKVVKPKKKTHRTTESHRNHRFQSFTERISKLKIDPIRRKRHVDGQETAEEISHTYFGESLQQWRDTNMSATFTAFAREASPLCDSLPVVLHNQHAIMDALVTYIGKADALAMEPLLNLLSHFAHDLDTRFEKHFQRAVATVASVAANHSDFAVIEWSFTCLAWLFKYLSRLLVPDLRPLYDLMAPYLGKEKQKPFTVRFAAESLSFLVKKAAVVYDRDQEPLDKIMRHMLEDCKESSAPDAHDLLQQGIMTMLTEAIRGVQYGVHSSADAILQSLFTQAAALAQHSYTAMEFIVCGSLTSLIHSTNLEGFKPVQDTIMTYTDKAAAEPASRESIRFCSSLLFTAVSVRKGSRISDWKAFMGIVKKLVAKSDELHLDRATAEAVLSLLAVTMQTATIDAVLATRQLLEGLRAGKWSPYFLQFCDTFARLGTDRFHDFILPHFQKYVVQQSSTGDSGLLSLIPRLGSTDVDHKLKCSKALIEDLLSSLKTLETATGVDEELLANTYLLLAATPFIALDATQTEKLRELLQALVEQSLKDTSVHHWRVRALGLGLVFNQLLNMQCEPSSLRGLWQSLCNIAPDFVGFAQFWSNLLRYIKLVKPSEQSAEFTNKLESTLVLCLSMASHSIRQDALDILQELYRLRGEDVPSILSTAITIESIPISLETARSISMNIRRLAPEYSALKEGDLMKKAVPTYCFGLLHVSLSQAWEDATNTLAAICQSKAGEEVVISLAQTWIDGKSTNVQGPECPLVVDVNTDGFKVLSDFECPNLAKFSAIRAQVFQAENSGLPLPTDQLTLALQEIPVIHTSAREQALKVLHKIPQVAEKRSRLLVPVLLRWSGSEEPADLDESDTDRWVRKDQKALLAVFAQFVNPTVLYKSAEVFDALLALCANGDVDIQKSALRAVLAWKNKSVTRYEEHLLNILDEARFREELSVFLQDADDDEDEVGIRSEDHAGLMPVLLRLLYGRAISGGKEGQSGRRKAIFVALSRFGEQNLEEFLNIAFKSIRSDGSAQKLPQVQAPIRQQLGLVNMMNDMLQVLGSELQPFSTRLLRGILACTVGAAQELESGQTDDQSLLRSVRQTGIQCLVKIYSSVGDSDALHNGGIILKELVQPRMSSFAAENAQSVSGLLRLFSAWSEHVPRIFTGNGAIVLANVSDLLRNPHTKGEVRLFILQEILDHLVKIDDLTEGILQPHVSSFVKSIGGVIDQQPPKDVLDACVISFSQLASRITSSDEAVHVTKTCTDLLTKPNKAVSPSTKSGLLQTILPLIESFGVDAMEELYAVLCGLYSRLTHAPSRVLLSTVVKTLVKEDKPLSEVAQICQDMNAMGTKLDEPDHERRESAFTTVYELKASFSLQQWLPIVHNMLFFIRDSEDRFNRTSASHGLRLFVNAAAGHPDEPEWLTLIESVVMVGIERGVQDKSELVRAEYLIVLNQIVQQFPSWQKVSSMQSLIVGGDEEASVFTNVLAIQQHRRLRALRRLADEADDLGSYNASRIFLPLVEHFVFDAMEGDAGLTLSNQAIQTIGSLARALNKSAFRATFQRYVGYLKNKDKEDLEKVVLRLLSAMVDGIQRTTGDDEVTATGEKKPSQVSEAIIKEQLPPLLEYLHQKDESTVDRRMPIAVTIVKLMSGLSQEEFAARLPAVLTDVTQVLRSRSQEARDQTRKALAAISRIIGSQYFGFILKELRGSLKRGYQLHVLSYTVHTLLVDPHFAPGDLDECLPALMDVIMDDIFGVTGQEKDAEEYKSGMKEIKSSKSYDTLELLARVTPIQRLGALILPIRNMLSETLDTRSIKKIDDLLTRLRKGLDQNPESESRQVLSFCWEVVNQVHNEDGTPVAAPKPVDEVRRRYLVQPEPEKKKLQPKGSTTSYRFKLISFAFDLLRKVIRRHEDLQTPANMAGFLPMAGDALVQGQEEVKLSAVRLLSTIMRTPMKQLEENAPVYVKEAVAMIKGAVSTTTDASKAALELITSVLREKRSVEIKERDIALLLKRIKHDIDEPDRQGVVYKFLRAILGRKIVITEVYEVMDEVGKVMVSNPDRSIRESARSAYLQFVMDFPQGKDRWEKQTAFLVGNLRYEHAAGRQSMMEFLHQLLNKVGDDVINDRAPKIFLNLVPILVADSDNACRDMARILVGKIFERAEDEKLVKQLLASMDNWLKSDKALLRSGALQCWAVLLRTKNLPQKQIEGLRDQLAEIITDEGEEEDIADPQVILDTLQTFGVIVESVPAVAFSQESCDFWKGIQQLAATDEARIQEAVTTLLGAYFTDFASTSSKTAAGLAGVPLHGSGGLELDAESMRDLCRVSLRALRGITLSTTESLTAQVIRNLTFLGRCFSASEMPWASSTTSNTANDEEEDDEEDAEDSHPVTSETALAHLLRRLSSMLTSNKFYIISRIASLQTLSSLISTLPSASIPSLTLTRVLRPLYALTDSSVPKSQGEKPLTDKAHELLELLQKTLGSEKYLEILAEVRKAVKGKREERRQKRRIEAVSEPERWLGKRQRRYEAKKVRQKEKGVEARGRRRGW